MTSTRKRKKITQKYLENSGAHYLNRFTASRAHFKKIMMRKIDNSLKEHPDQNREACLAMLDDVISKFVSLGYLDDSSYAIQVVRAQRRKGKSAKAVEQALRYKGVSPDDIQAALKTHHEDIDEKFSRQNHDQDIERDNQEWLFALRLCQKKRFGPFAKDPAQSDKKKDMARLARAGYNYETTIKVLSIPYDEAEKLVRIL